MEKINEHVYLVDLDELGDSPDFLTIYREVQEPLKVFANDKVTLALDEKEKNITRLTFQTRSDSLSSEIFEAIIKKINSSSGWNSIPADFAFMQGWYRNYLIGTYLKMVLLYVCSITGEKAIDIKKARLEIKENEISLSTGVPFSGIITSKKNGKKNEKRYKRL